MMGQRRLLHQDFTFFAPVQKEGWVVVGEFRGSQQVAQPARPEGLGCLWSFDARNTDFEADFLLQGLYSFDPLCHISQSSFVVALTDCQRTF